METIAEITITDANYRSDLIDGLRRIIAKIERGDVTAAPKRFAIVGHTKD